MRRSEDASQLSYTVHIKIYTHRFIATLINPESGLEAASTQTHHIVGFEEILIFVTDIFSGSSFSLGLFKFLCSFVFICGI